MVNLPIQRSGELAFWLVLLLSVFSAQVYGAQVIDNQLERGGALSILVVPEYDQDSLASTHRAYLTAGAKIQDQLAHEFQFAVYDGSSRNINLLCKQQCDGMARERLIKKLREQNSQLELGKLEHPPVDVLVFFHIMSKDMFTDIGVKRLIRISSLAIDLKSGNTIAYDDGGQQQARFINPAEDLTNWTLSIANRHARDSAAFIGERLEVYQRSRYRPHSRELIGFDIDLPMAHRYGSLLAVMTFILAVLLLRASLKNRKLRRVIAGLKDTHRRVN